jgi:phosphate butyryltransferase
MNERINEPIKSAREIIESARRLARKKGRKTVAVAGANDTAVLEALASAYADGILDAVLFGDKNEINRITDEINIDISGFSIEHCPDPEKATFDAVEMASSGIANVIMKGFVPTSLLLKTVFLEQFNLRLTDTVSHVAVLDIPRYHKLFLMTDGGVVVKPNIEQKIDILKNAVSVARALGLRHIKIALSAATDKISENDLQTLACRQVLDKLTSAGLDNVEVVGPMTFDCAVSPEIAKLKNIGGNVAGDADIFLVDSIEECNIIGKALINFAGAIFAGVIVGARVPISLVSRTDTILNKKASVSIACLMAEYYKKTGITGESQ